MGNKFSDRNLGGDSLRSKAKGLEQRMKEIETGFAQIITGVDRRFGQVGQMLGQNSELLEALLEHVGADAVNDIVERKRMERAEANTAAEKKALEDAMNDGFVTVADAIAEDSFIVGYETLASGKPLGTGRQQVAFESLSEAYKEQLLGKGVGEVVKTPTGGTFEVKEVYKLDKEKGQAVMEERARKQAEEAQQAAEEAAVQDETKEE